MAVTRERVTAIWSLPLARQQAVAGVKNDDACLFGSPALGYVAWSLG